MGIFSFLKYIKSGDGISKIVPGSFQDIIEMADETEVMFQTYRRALHSVLLFRSDLRGYSMSTSKDIFQVQPYVGWLES